MAKYIKVKDLQDFCDNQKDHTITPNDFQRMTQYDFGWHVGTPIYMGRYLVSNGYDTSISYFDGKEFIKDFLGFPNVGDIVKWQKIEP